MSEQDDILDKMDEDMDALPKEEVVEEVISPEEEPAPRETHGRLTHEEWIAAGKDPDDYKGQNAFDAEHARIQEIRELKNVVQHVASGFDSWKAEQTEANNQILADQRVELIAELKKQTDDENTVAALAVKDRITEIDSRVKSVAPAQSQGEEAVISKFRSQNAICDPSNASYNPEFDQDVANYYSTEMAGLGNNTTDAQKEKVLALSLVKAKALNPDLFVSPRNNRQGSPQVTRRAKSKGGDDLSALKGHHNSKNANDTESTMDIYNMLKKSDPKVAETYAKNISLAIGEN